MTEIKKMMQEKENGVEEQYYPETHAEAVNGLEEYVKKILKELKGGVVS